MSGTWKRSLIVLALVPVLAPCRSAWAFHAGSTFDKPPGAGGGGGIFYTGSPRSKGWGCSMCHLDASGELRVRLGSDPKDLLESLTYVPGQSYRLTVSLSNERRGLGASLSNYNTMAISSESPEGRLVGRFSGYAAEDYFARGDAILAASGTTPNQTEWAFDWTAPEPGEGTVGLYIGLVDGNGAQSGATETLTDPFGDDAVMGNVQFREQGTESTERARRPTPGAARGGPTDWRWLLLPLLGLVLAGLRTSHEPGPRL